MRFVFCEISHFKTFARILVFNPYERIGQLCSSLVLHGIIITTKIFRRPEVRAIFRKTCNLRNFAFYNFSENLDFQSYEEGWETLQVPLISRSIIKMPNLHKKRAVRTIFKKMCNLRNFSFYNFGWNLVFNPYKRIEQLCSIYNMVSLLRQSFSESLESGLSSEKLVICKISHFTNLNRHLVYFPSIKHL